jgi:hypothetical protein
MAFGGDRNDAIREFVRVFETQIELDKEDGVVFLSRLPATPPKYLAMAEGGQELTTDEVKKALAGYNDDGTQSSGVPFRPAFIEREAA